MVFAVGIATIDVIHGVDAYPEGKLHITLMRCFLRVFFHVDVHAAMSFWRVISRGYKGASERCSGWSGDTLCCLSFDIPSTF